MKLSDTIQTIHGVGDEMTKKFRHVSIETIDDLIHYLPRRYDDYSEITPISQLKPGQVSIEATITNAKGRYVRRGMHITEAIANDASGSVRLIWFNQPYRATSIKPSTTYFISGDFALRRQYFSMQNPSVETASDFPVHTARIVPIYRETKGLTSTQIRKAIRASLPMIRALPETLPLSIVSKQNLVSRRKALEELHFPSNKEMFALARRRYGFEEIFELTLAALLNKYELMQETSVAISFDKKLAVSFVSKLPFQLTDDQRKSVWRIYQDMQKTQPMNRLLEGDVGSGKTIVAVMAAIMAMKQGFQVALMAPTEILARQHADTIRDLLRTLDLEHEVVLLLGSTKPAQKSRIQKKIADGSVRFMIGTHALIAEKVDMHNLGLIIIDEQHRFGVEQRKKLQAKAGHMPHVLHMSATPIPRSLALTLYGELDISILESSPAGRKPVITQICSPNSRKQLYAKIDAELEEGRQMFVVCPLIADSDTQTASSAETVYETLRTKDFKHRRAGLLHGKMKPDEKDAVMRKFLNHKLDILVSTTVIEVGVHVPNASIMLIESAERFGLAQAHQLRGRVGRAEHQGYCYLMISDSKAPSRRLRALAQMTDGFALAELDLELRGPGSMYGTLQHGVLDLRVASLADTKLIAAARNSAQAFIDSDEDLLHYKHLNQHVQERRAITNLN
ncbi:ATP-dependent DNA helicase RecG [soil metagenome]